MRLPIYPRGAIIAEGKNALALGRRFLDDLAEFGIDDAFLNEFEQAIQDAEALPDDQYNVMQMKAATHVKDDILDDCVSYIKNFRIRLGRGFGRTSHEYGEFTGDQLRSASANEEAMMDLMENVIRRSEEYQASLESVGLTPEVVQAGKDLLQDLRESDATQELKKIERPASTVERIEAHQRVYDMANDILRTGRRVFEDSPTEYRLFGSPWGKYRSKTVPTEEELQEALEE